MQIRNAFYRLAKTLTEEKQSAKAIEVLTKAEKTVSLKLWPVDYQSILMASMYAPNGQKQLGENRFRELAHSMEEQLTYFASFPSSRKKTILDEASYQLALYNELIQQATDTLPEAELKMMKEKLMVFAEKLG
jgi:hypothetical protein